MSSEKKEFRELLELALLDAVGLLDEQESAAFENSIGQAPQTMRDQILAEQSQLLVPGEVFPDRRPLEELRQRVLAAVSEGYAASRRAQVEANTSPVSVPFRDQIGAVVAKLDADSSGLYSRIVTAAAIVGLCAGLLSARTKPLGPIIDAGDGTSPPAAAIVAFGDFDAEEEFIAALPQVSKDRSRDELLRELTTLAESLVIELEGGPKEQGFWRDLLPEDSAEATKILVGIAAILTAIGGPGLLHWQVYRRKMAAEERKLNADAVLASVKTVQVQLENEKLALDIKQAKKAVTEAPELIVVGMKFESRTR